MTLAQDRPQWTLVAQLLRPQGRKGELLAELSTDFPERFAAGARVFLLAPARSGNRSGSGLGATSGASPSEPRPCTIEAHWLPLGKNAGRVVLKFEGVDSISEAELLAGHEVVVPLEERVSLEQGAAYISDLVGCSVFDGPTRVGAVADVQFPSEEGAGVPDSAPMLVVKDAAGEEILIPFVKAWLRSLDAAAKRIEMDLPEGLLGINAPGDSGPDDSPGDGGPDGSPGNGGEERAPQTEKG